MLARHGLGDEAAYRDASAKSRASIEAGLASGDSSGVVAYAAAFRRALTAATAPPDGPAPVRLPLAPPEPPVKPRRSSGECRRCLAAPPRLAAPLAPVAPPRLDATLEQPLRASANTLPFARAGLVGSSAVHEGAGRGTEPASPSVEPVRAPKPRDADDLDATANIDVTAVRREALPFASGAGAHPSDRPPPVAPGASPVGHARELTLEQYASLCAEFGTSPPRLPRPAPRLRHSRRRGARCAGAWRRRFEVEPGLVTRWIDLRLRYAAWLTRGAPPRSDVVGR